ncbi:hypothetical protein QFC21_007096 [Naganishia friedmannii]|uniref:Uncharacterized protein n=1 Tax=Naganishia friedmannii TaxID=89922 RepID=A0ACC2UXJ0_9TREE|nr:hypothetical protein QFC21_007096 [Naganishia friedmannii]
MPQAVIPVEMYSVIAEILAGDQAFGTLANLNLANHAIRDETLPVLFETLLFDDYVTLALEEEDLCSSLGDTYDWLHLLPNLALTVSLGSPPPGDTCFDYCIRLYKPLKPITVFGCVTKTRLSPRLLKDLAQDDAGHPISDETSVPSASRRLMRFVLEHGAYFIAEDPAAPNNVVEWTTNIMMENSYFVEDPGPVSSTAGDEPSITNDGQIADTICELLKLTIRQCPSVRVEEGRHLGILHTRPAVDKFFEKIILSYSFTVFDSTFGQIVQRTN